MPASSRSSGSRSRAEGEGQIEWARTGGATPAPVWSRTGLCADGYGDVDVHLHHDHDRAAGLREKLDQFRETLHERHGLLRRHPVTGPR